jgi:predicted transposase/invertase (TIGR01784 family)
MKTFPTPHDSFFRKFFSDASVAADFLQIHLPPALQAKCDFSTLAITSGSFVEADMRNQFSDILYSMKTPSGPGYVYCLIEHQSSPDEIMAFRLLRYSIAAMHRHLKQGHKRLPLIVPVLFYHGKQSPYPYSMRWLDCFENPAAAQTLYTQAFPLVDITVIPDDEIKTHRKVALLEYVQKHIHEKDINIHLPNITELMGKFKPSKEEVQSLMHYLTQEGNALDSKKFIHNLIENTPRYREDLMTIAEYLKQEGRQEGRQEGGRKREKEIARNLLSIGLEHNVILQATGMSRAELDDLMDSAVKENR